MLSKFYISPTMYMIFASLRLELARGQALCLGPHCLPFRKEAWHTNRTLHLQRNACWLQKLINFPFHSENMSGLPRVTRYLREISMTTKPGRMSAALNPEGTKRRRTFKITTWCTHVIQGDSYPPNKSCCCKKNILLEQDRITGK